MTKTCLIVNDDTVIICIYLLHLIFVTTNNNDLSRDYA